MQDFDAEEEEGEGFTLSDVRAILRMQWRIIAAGILFGVVLSTMMTVMATRYYRARSVVMISTLANQEMEMGKAVSNSNMVWNRDLYINTQIALLSSRSLKAKVLNHYEDLGLEDGIKADGAGFGLLARSTEISKRKNTELLDIRVTTPDPELSARLANLTAEVLRDDSLESTTDAALSAKAWLTGQIEEYDIRINQASRELLAYQRANNMADVEDETTTLGARMSSLKSAYGEANTERVQQQTLVNEHEILLRRGRYEELAKQMNTTGLQLLRQGVTRATADLTTVAAVFGPKMEEHRIAIGALEEANELLKAEVKRTLSAERAQLQVLLSREAALETEINGGKSQLLDAQGLYDDYEKKRLDLETTKQFYRQMKERFGELELQSKTQLNNVRIIEEARPKTSAVSPNGLSNLLGGLIGGLTLGLMMAFAREWLDDTISSQLDVTTYLKVPLLGLVPKITENVDDETERTLYTHFNPKSNLAEAARGLRTVIELNPHGEAPKRLLVTSALSSEGKTSTAMRLAIAYANLGRRVVVIDADLRRPRIHKVFKTDKEPGFATVLTTDMPVKDVIRETPVQNLYYISAGKGSDRPTEILASKEMRVVLDELDRLFDIVIVDSPPSVLLSDARILSRHVDGVVVMVKEKSTSRVLIREAVRGLQQVGARVLGVVVNEIDFSRQKNNYYYGYSYSYRYDDYYSDDDQDAAAK